MPFPAPLLHPQPINIPPAIIHTLTRENVLWDRPVFKAPPLVLQPARAGNALPQPVMDPDRDAD